MNDNASDSGYDLISLGYIDRERDGSAYWRVDQPEENL